jgi:hypothetical protein
MFAFPGKPNISMEIHIHVNLDGRQLANAVMPYMIGATGGINLRNSGKGTGALKPS